jgi:hypothetical protein
VGLLLLYCLYNMLNKAAQTISLLGRGFLKKRSNLTGAPSKADRAD